MTQMFCQLTRPNSIKNASDDEVHIPGYDIIRRDRIVKGGGGVGFYVFPAVAA